MVVIERLFIETETHRLEALLGRHVEGCRGVWALCHPYPPYGGDMYHKVVVKLAELLTAEGFAALRFNLRGVGRSTGLLSESREACQDLESVLSWLAEKHPKWPRWVAGYSYGAFVALSTLAVRGPDPSVRGAAVEGALAVAYPAGKPEYRLKTLPEIKTCFVHGVEDELIPASTVQGYLASQQPTPKLHLVEGANHFFDGKLGAFQEACRVCLASLG
jgi:alpha/beta superfamily hydrolase